MLRSAAPTVITNFAEPGFSGFSSQAMALIVTLPSFLNICSTLAPVRSASLSLIPSPLLSTEVSKSQT